MLVPKLFDDADRSSFRLNISALDPVNGLLSEPDLMGELVLTEAEDSPRGAQLGSKRHPLKTHQMVEM